MKRDHHYFENYARANNMKPVVKVSDPQADILIADSGRPFYGPNAHGELGFWYRTAFCFLRDKAWLASAHEYPAADYYGVSDRQGQEQRVNDCLGHARTMLKLTSEVGLYD